MGSRKTSALPLAFPGRTGLNWIVVFWVIGLPLPIAVDRRLNARFYFVDIDFAADSRMRMLGLLGRIRKHGAKRGPCHSPLFADIQSQKAKHRTGVAYQDSPPLS